jgi:hypothetical protein
VPGCIHCANSREPRNGYEVVVNGISWHNIECDCTIFNRAYYFSTLYMVGSANPSLCATELALPTCPPEENPFRDKRNWSTDLRLIAEGDDVYRVQYVLASIWSAEHPWHHGTSEVWEKVFDAPPDCLKFDDDLQRVASDPLTRTYSNCTFPPTVHLRSLL